MRWTLAPGRRLERTTCAHSTTRVHYLISAIEWVHWALRWLLSLSKISGEMCNGFPFVSKSMHNHTCPNLLRGRCGSLHVRVLDNLGPGRRISTAFKITLLLKYRKLREIVFCRAQEDSRPIHVLSCNLSRTQWHLLFNVRIWGIALDCIFSCAYLEHGKC